MDGISCALRAVGGVPPSPPFFPANSIRRELEEKTGKWETVSGSRNSWRMAGSCDNLT